jgi:serine/threonine-protein kinase HipA
MRQLIAWIDDRRVGEFTESHESDDSLFAFEYDQVTQRDLVSLTMIPEPDRLRFQTRSFPAAFDMILPEGERRGRIEEARKILRSDPFSLLSYVGANPVNRVRFLEPGRTPGDDAPELPAPREIAECAEGRKLFKRLVDALDLRQGIAGVQPKILGSPAHRRKVSLDLRHFRGSTHILKSSTRPYPFLAANEHVCLQIFKAAGLEVPKSILSADGELLLVERFDIRADKTCMGFEEAAALMGETSAGKYQRDYGSMFDSLAAFVPAAAEDAVRRELTKALLLNYLLGNGDAHLKNFGVLYSDAGDVRLAPFYDCVSTLPYIPDDVPALALSFEWYSKAWWPRIKLEEFATTYGRMSEQDIGAVIDETAAAVADGCKLIRGHARDIAGFEGLGMEISTLWDNRLAAFLDASGGTR